LKTFNIQIKIQSLYIKIKSDVKQQMILKKSTSKSTTNQTIDLISDEDNENKLQTNHYRRHYRKRKYYINLLFKFTKKLF
jgi:hypothetical protein